MYYSELMDRRSFFRHTAITVGSYIFSSCLPVSVLDTKNGYKLPDYYFKDDYLSLKVSRINQLLKEDETIDAFIFITDQHWEYNTKYSPELMRYIQDCTGIKRVFCGGDIADLFGEESFDYMRCLKSSWLGEIHCVVGNHEYLGNENATEEKIQELFKTNPDIQIGNDKRHYYYVDDKDKLIRYIVLSSFSQSIDGGLHAQKGYGEEQENWLKKNALETVPKDWRIVLFTHYLYYIGMEDDKISITNGGQKIVDIINGYKGPGVIAALFHGHNHRDRIYYVQESSIPVIFTTCDKYKKISNDQQYSTREIKTINEQAFDVVILQKHQIICVRIGSPAKDGIGDRIGKDVEERIIEY